MRKKTIVTTEKETLTYNFQLDMFSRPQISNH